MSADLVVAVLSAGGVGAALLALVNGIIKWLSGASGRERAKNTELATQRINAIKERDESNLERDEADKQRRRWEEIAHKYKLQLHAHGIQPGEYELDVTQQPEPKKEKKK